MASLQGFPKREHLCLQRDIDALYERPDGTATAWPIRCIWRRVEPSAQVPVQVLISVPKRRLHHAVDRNRAKRQIREAYRLNKLMLTTLASAEAEQNQTASVPSQPSDVQGLHIAFMWIADQSQHSDRVHQAIRRLLSRIASQSAQ